MATKTGALDPISETTPILPIFVAYANAQVHINAVVEYRNIFQKSG